MRLFLVAAIAALTCGHTVAQTDQPLAQFGSFFVDPDVPGVVALTGEIGQGAPLDFRRAIKAHPEVKTLALASPGGDVTAALLVAQEVAFLGFETFIPSDYGCYSACAFIFLAGETRQVEGELGVHQISGEKDDDYSTQLAIADILDGMAEFGVPPKVIADMLRTPPNSMKIYSKADAEALQINRSANELAQAAETQVQPSEAVFPEPAEPSKMITIDHYQSRDRDSVWSVDFYQVTAESALDAVFLTLDFTQQDFDGFAQLLTSKFGSSAIPAWSRLEVVTEHGTLRKSLARVSLYTPEPPDGLLLHRVSLERDASGSIFEITDPNGK